MSADIFTNGFQEAGKWKAACDLINVVDFTKIKVKTATWQWKEEEQMDHKRNHHEKSQTMLTAMDQGKSGEGATAPVKRKR